MILQKCLFFFATATLLTLTVDAYYYRSAAQKSNGHLLTNKTPKNGDSLGATSSSSFYSNACDECKMIITRLREVVKNPEKLAELKLLLNLLCHQTDYESECKLFVKNIDQFVDRLLPYLGNPLHVCQELHICGNSNIERFHNVGVFFANRMLPNSIRAKKDLLCEECQFAAHELDDLIERPEFQRDAKNWLSSNVCAFLGNYKGSCDLLLEDFLPEFFQELHVMLQNNKQFCLDLELCTASGLGQQIQPIRINHKIADSSSSEEEEVSKVQKRVSRRVIATILTTVTKNAAEEDN